MKRLLLAAGLVGISLSAPANATIWACDNMPVSAQCFSHRYGRWCTVWAAGQCVTADRILDGIGTTS